MIITIIIISGEFSLEGMKSSSQQVIQSGHDGSWTVSFEFDPDPRGWTSWQQTTFSCFFSYQNDVMNSLTRSGFRTDERMVRTSSKLHKTSFVWNSLLKIVCHRIQCKLSSFPADWKPSRNEEEIESDSNVMRSLSGRSLNGYSIATYACISLKIYMRHLTCLDCKLSRFGAIGKTWTLVRLSLVNTIANQFRRLFSPSYIGIALRRSSDSTALDFTPLLPYVPAERSALD